MLKVAVIGAGAMGRNHVRVYQEMPDVELVAIVDQSRSTAEQIGNVYRVPVYEDYQEMLEQEHPDAVSIAVPTQAHFSVASTLLEAKCHVLVEKPITQTMEEAYRLIEIAEKNDLVLAVGHIERYNPAIIELKRRLTAGELGRIFQIHARRLGPFPMRIRDVGVLMDLATHDLDIMQYLVGKPVSRLFAETKREVHALCEDLLIGVLRFEDTTLGLLEINWLTPTKIRELYVTGERGMFKVNYLTQDLFYFENAETQTDSWNTLSILQGVSQGSMVHFPIKKKEPLRAELEAFVARVRGEESRVVDGIQAASTLALTLKLAESAWQRGANEENHHEGNGRTTDRSFPGAISKKPSVFLSNQAGD